MKSEMRELNDNFWAGGAVVDGRLVVFVVVVAAVVVLVVFGFFVCRVETGFFVVSAVLFFVDISVGEISNPLSISSESDFFKAIGNL